MFCNVPRGNIHGIYTLEAVLFMTQHGIVKHVRHSCAPFMCAIHVCHSCAPFMCAIHVCHSCVPYMCAIHVRHSTCVPFNMYMCHSCVTHCAIHVCHSTCAPFMCAIHVCAIHGPLSPLSRWGNLVARVFQTPLTLSLITAECNGD